MKIKSIALFYPWLNLYGGGEVFAEYTANKLSSKKKIDFYYYGKKKIHPKLNFDKKVNLIPISSRNILIDFMCSNIMLFAQTYLIFFFNKKVTKDYLFVYSLGGEFFSKFKTFQYLHICIFSLNIFEYKNFGIKSFLKKIARFLVVLICRIILKINKNKFYNVITFSNSKWSFYRAKKTYNIKKHKVFYPNFKVPNLYQQSFENFEKRRNNFVILGRVSADKNIIDAFKLLKKLKSFIPDAFFHIIGPIDQKYFIKIKKNYSLHSVKFYGLISKSKRDFLLKTSKYGLNFFYSEHFGRNVLEMQKCGVIVFARNRGGVRELLFNKNQKYDNYKDLIDNIKKIHFHQGLRNKIYMLNQKILKNQFTSEQFDRELLDFLK